MTFRNSLPLRTIKTVNFNIKLMKQQFLNFLSEKLELSGKDKILLAVSGGADSMVMLDLFVKTGFQVGVAHCNFHLRGQESDLDEKLVEEIAKKHKLPFYRIDFETKKHAQNNGISIEMAARELRYQWFERISKDFDYQHIAIAHHQDDIIETFFINLTRGTGIKGLSGIKEKNGNIIRPLLFTNRKEILSYAEKNSLKYRFDASNDDTNIIRNKFRHEILPKLKEVNPAAFDNILQTIEHLRSAEAIMLNKVEEVKKSLFITENGLIRVNIKKLKELNPLESYLFELLRPFDFNSAQTMDICKSLGAESGKSFYSSTHMLVKDRDELIITALNERTTAQFEITESDTLIDLLNGQQLAIKKISKDDGFKIPTDSQIAAIDLDKLKFPLRIRGWEEGDYFFPLGMDKKKKLSDFFIDQKMSLVEKQSACLLLSDNEIVWTMGKRLDNRFKITASTQNILLLELF
jgi:tRNA(Ile)-lysidine synthase